MRATPHSRMHGTWPGIPRSWYRWGGTRRECRYRCRLPRRTGASRCCLGSRTSWKSRHHGHVTRRVSMAEQRVEVGIYLPQVGFTYDEIAERAQWVEELGFHSLWLFDHIFFEGMDIPTLEGWTLATA